MSGGPFAADLDRIGGLAAGLPGIGLAEVDAAARRRAPTCQTVPVSETTGTDASPLAPMGAGPAGPVPTAPTAAPAPRSVLLRTVGWLLLVGWCAVVVGWALAPRPAAYGDLLHAVAVGEVDRVEAAGGLGLEGARGAATVELSWKVGWREYRTVVVEARPRRQAEGMATDERTGVTRDIAADLAGVGDGATLVATEYRERNFPITTEIAGREFTGAWSALVLVCGVGQLMLLVAGPRPWRATRWAWFWVGFTWMPVGGIAYLLLSGATVQRAPRPGGRVLTGGWAFLLALALGTFTANLP